MYLHSHVDVGHFLEGYGPLIFAYLYVLFRYLIFLHGDLLTSNVLDVDFNITMFIKVK